MVRFCIIGGNNGGTEQTLHGAVGHHRGERGEGNIGNKEKKQKTRQHRPIPDLYGLNDLYDPYGLNDLYDLYDLGHDAGSDPYSLSMMIAHMPWVGSELRVQILYNLSQRQAKNYS